MGRIAPCLVGLSVFITSIAPAAKDIGALSALEAGDKSLVRQGIEDAARLKSPQAARALAERIRKGLPPDLLLPAVEALAAIGGSPAQQTLSMLLIHRCAEVRARAASALARLKSPGAVGALSVLLDDEDPSVRASAALGLSELGPDAAMPRLVLAASVGEAVAAEVVARKARPMHASAVTQRLDSPMEGPWADCLEKLLLREDWPVAARVALADRILSSKAPGGVGLLEKVVSMLDEKNPARKGYVSKLEALVPREKQP